MPAGRQHYGGLDPHTGPIDYENDSMGMWDQSAGDTFELPMKRVLRDVVDARTRCLGTGGEGSLWQLLLDDGEGKIVYHPPDFKITVDQTIYDGNVKYVGASRKTSVIECLQDSNYTRVTAVGAGSATIGMILSKAEYEAGQPGNEFPAIGDSVSFSFENVRFEWTRSDAVSTPNLFILNNVDNGYITHCDFITTENDTYYYTPIDCARGVSGFEVSHSYFEINCEDLQGGLWIRSLNHTKPTENIHYHHLHVVSNTNDEPLSVFADDTTNSGPLRNIKVDHILFEMVGPNCNGPSMTNNAWGPTGTVNEPIEKPELDFDAHMSNLTVVMWNMNRFCFQLKNAHGCSLRDSRAIVYNVVSDGAAFVTGQSTDVELDEQKQPVLVDNISIRVVGDSYDLGVSDDAPHVFNGRMVNRDCSVTVTPLQQTVVTTASGDFTVGGEVRNNADPDLSTKHATVVKVSGTAPNLTIRYEMSSDNVDFVNGDTMYDADSGETATCVTPTTTGTQLIDTVHLNNFGGGSIRDGNYRLGSIKLFSGCTDVRGGHYFWDLSLDDTARRIFTVLSGSSEIKDKTMKYHDVEVTLTDDPPSSAGRVFGTDSIQLTQSDPYTVSMRNITVIGSTSALPSTGFTTSIGGNAVVSEYKDIKSIRNGVVTRWDNKRFRLASTGTLPKWAPMIELDHDTVAIAAVIADASEHQGLFAIKNSSDSGTAAHTVTLTSGTFDGTNTVATLDAPGEALVVHFDRNGNGVIVSNTGGVALS